MFKATTIALLCAGLGSAALADGKGTPAIEPRVIIDDAASSSGNGNAVAITVMLLAAVLIATSDNSALVSDARLKTDIRPAGRAANGLPLYDFRYAGDTTTWRGVMAQDVLNHTPEAVITLDNGYHAVNYKMLGIEMTRVD